MRNKAKNEAKRENKQQKIKGDEATTKNNKTKMYQGGNRQTNVRQNQDTIYKLRLNS